jgi:TPR repeat protein
MKRLIQVFLMLIFMSAPVYADDFQEGLDAYDRKDYKTALEKWKPLAEQGLADAQSKVGTMYQNGQGVPQDYALAHMWWSLAGSNGDKDAVTNLNIVEKEMSPEQIEEAQEMARKWIPNTPNVLHLLLFIGSAVFIFWPVYTYLFYFTDKTAHQYGIWRVPKEMSLSSWLIWVLVFGGITFLSFYIAFYLADFIWGLVYVPLL